MAGMQKSLASTGLLFFGTLSSLLNKIIYGLEGRGRSGKIKAFEKPWASTAIMFVGMAFCLPINPLLSLLSKSKRPAPRPDEAFSEPLLENDQEDQPSAQQQTSVKWKDALLVAVPTILDLAATVLMSIGLLSVTASVYQMLRGAEMLFAALFALTILKRPLVRKHYIGLACCFVGILLVGTSSLISSSDESSTGPGQVLAGMALIVVAQAVQAAQITVEDYVLRDIGVAPLTVVGWEGVWGCIFMFGILLPAVQFLPGRDGGGIHEDSLDTIHMISHSIPAWAIPTILAATGGCLLLYNVTGMFVTDEIGAVARTVLESLRTLFVWLADLALFYIPLPKGLGRIGERWDDSSYLQALGFVILVIGTLVYGRGDEEQEQKHEQAGYGGRESGKAPKHGFSAVSTIASWSRKSHQRWKAATEAVLAEAGMRNGQRQS